MNNRFDGVVVFDATLSVFENTVAMNKTIAYSENLQSQVLTLADTITEFEAGIQSQIDDILAVAGIAIDDPLRDDYMLYLTEINKRGDRAKAIQYLATFRKLHDKVNGV